MLRYSEKVYGLRMLINGIRDSRRQPVFKTSSVFGGALVMALARMGSLNALEQIKGIPFWGRWLGHPLTSADTTGRVFAGLDCTTVRMALRHIYSKLKRNKALKGGHGGMYALVIDGHESSASYLRCCEGCLERTIHTVHGDRTQYYHRNVTALLLCNDFCILLDMEPQRPGEDEVAAGIRLLKRMNTNFPCAFDVVLVDGLYVRANFFKFVLDCGKNVIAVLKDERRELLEDAQCLFRTIKPVVCWRGRTQRQLWDVEHFSTWQALEREVRVVRSLETAAVRRQITGEKETQISDWIWVTTLSQEKVPTEAIVDLGHGRWSIENNAFNEMATYWHSGHVYKHHPVAIEAFWLLTMLAYNIFHAFIQLNIKPVLRAKHTNVHWADLIAGDLYGKLMHMVEPAPT